MRSVVVPAYNEEERMPGAIKALLELEDLEIIVSDDGSRDRTLEVARGFLKDHKNLIVIGGGHLGKGAALKRGFNACKGDVMGFLDADLSAKPSELSLLFKELEMGGVDLAIGSRELPGSIVPLKQPLHRRALGTVYSLLARVLFGVKVKDFQCGCKAFKREVWEAVDIRSDGFVFDTELIAKAASKGFNIKEVPITWTNDERTKVNPLKDPIKMFIGLIRIKWWIISEGR